MQLRKSSIVSLLLDEEDEDQEEEDDDEDDDEDELPRQESTQAVRALPLELLELEPDPEEHLSR